MKIGSTKVDSHILHIVHIQECYKWLCKPHPSCHSCQRLEEFVIMHKYAKYTKYAKYAKHAQYICKYAIKYVTKYAIKYAEKYANNILNMQLHYKI